MAGVCVVCVSVVLIDVYCFFSFLSWCLIFFVSKITRASLPAVACALAAHTTQRPVRVALSLPHNMRWIGIFFLLLFFLFCSYFYGCVCVCVCVCVYVVVGKRHPFLCDYKVGYNMDGTIQPNSLNALVADSTISTLIKGMIQALSLSYYNDGGCSYDSSFGMTWNYFIVLFWLGWVFVVYKLQ